MGSAGLRRGSTTTLFLLLIVFAFLYGIYMFVMGKELEYVLRRVDSGSVQLPKGDAVVAVAYVDGNVYALVRSGTSYYLERLEGNDFVRVVSLPFESLSGSTTRMIVEGNYIVAWSMPSNQSRGGIVVYNYVDGAVLDLGGYYTIDGYLISVGVDEYNGALYVAGLYYLRSEGVADLLIKKIYKSGSRYSADIVFDKRIRYIRPSSKVVYAGNQMPQMYFSVYGDKYLIGPVVLVGGYEEFFCTVEQNGDYVCTGILPHYGSPIYSDGVLIEDGARDYVFHVWNMGNYLHVVKRIVGRVGYACYRGYIPVATGFDPLHYSIVGDVLYDGNRVLVYVFERNQSTLRYELHVLMFDPNNCSYTEDVNYVTVDYTGYPDFEVANMTGKNSVVVLQNGSTVYYEVIRFERAHDFEVNILDARYVDGNVNLAVAYSVDINGVELLFKVSETNCYGRYTLDPEQNVLSVSEPCELLPGTYVLSVVVDPDEVFYDVNTANNFDSVELVVATSAPAPQPVGGGGGGIAAAPPVEENVVQAPQEQPSQLSVAPAVPSTWIAVILVLLLVVYVLYRYSTKG